MNANHDSYDERIALIFRLKCERRNSITREEHAKGGGAKCDPDKPCFKCRMAMSRGCP